VNLLNAQLFDALSAEARDSRRVQTGLSAPGTGARNHRTDDASS